MRSHLHGLRDGDLLAAVRDAARGAGLLGPAVAAAEPPPGAAEALDRWLGAGFNGEMGYMARLGASRADPGAWAGWARSVALFADRYDASPAPADPARAAISRYARGEDYHHVLMRKLERAGFPLRQAGRRVLPFVDTSPLMEKALAAAGGLGWIGKNGNLLRAGEGSWFVLGGLATDARWPADPPVEDQCGTCTLCLTGCPTGAIVAPGVVDARRCISYLTIELKGPIPRPLRSLMGNRVFGCDDCQEVCPYNGPGERATEPAYAPRPGTHGLPLLELATLTEAGFLERFRGTALRRPRWRGLLRNVMVALGNWGAPEAVPGLAAGLACSEPLVRGHAAWGLGRVGQARAREMLIAALRDETDPWVREEMAAALAASPAQTGSG